MNPTAQLLEPEICELIGDGRYSELRDALHGVHPADVADIFSNIEPAQAALGFRFLLRDDAAMVFSYLEPDRQAALIKELGQEGALRVVDAMTPDDRIRLLDELPEGVAQRLVAELPPETRKMTQAILGYPERSVGRLMTPDYVRVRPEWTIAQAVDHIRRHGRDAETVNVVYVVDEQGRLIDDIRLRTLLFADHNATVESQMNRSFVSLRADQPEEDAVRLLQRYDRVALPVVDSRGVLIGIVTHDDLADVAQQLATESIQKLGGTDALEAPYMETHPFEMFRKRGFWLAALFVGQTITILTLGGFQETLDKAVVLVLFLPLVISCGGNSGSQAATLICRALALQEVAPGDWKNIIKHEVKTAALLALGLSAMGVLCVLAFWLMGHAKTEFPRHLAEAVALSIAAVVLWGTLVGSVLPLVLRKLKLDPATASSPMVATLMDASGTLIYLGVALVVLDGTIL
jgi:magnesium transporter